MTLSAWTAFHVILYIVQTFDESTSLPGSVCCGKENDDTAWLRPVPLRALGGVELKVACEKTRRWWGKSGRGKVVNGAFFRALIFPFFPTKVKELSPRLETQLIEWICARLRNSDKQKLKIVNSSLLFVWFLRCMIFANCRSQTADCMRQQDCKLNETKNIVIKVASSSTLPCSEKYM